MVCEVCWVGPVGGLSAGELSTGGFCSKGVDKFGCMGCILYLFFDWFQNLHGALFNEVLNIP